MNGIENFLDNLSENVPRNESEYLGDDGLFRCCKCDKKTEKIIKYPFSNEEKKVRCICDCQKKIIYERKEQDKKEEIERCRRKCFSETNMASWTFENDDLKNPELSKKAKDYAENFSDMKKLGLGWLMHGTCGTGKTYLAACIANHLLDNGYSVLMTNFIRLSNQLQGTFQKQDVIDELNKYSLLIIDDLGVEQQDKKIQPQVYEVIDNRYRSGLPMIITTNLSFEEMRTTKELKYNVIYERLFERCMPMEFKGVSRRRLKMRDTFFEMKEKYGW